jgi:hypothetical protein
LDWSFLNMEVLEDVGYLTRQVLAGALLLMGLFLLPSPTGAQGADPGIAIVAFHSQRIQDHAENRIKCEVFGEIRNQSDKNLTGVTVTVDFQDEKGKTVGTEEMVLILRVIETRKPVGEARPVKPGEFGNFSQETVQCPDAWLEGRIRYKVKKVDWQ